MIEQHTTWPDFDKKKNVTMATFYNTGLVLTGIFEVAFIGLFPNHKSVETLSCHSNQNAYATAIKNNIFVEANATNISTKF